MKLWLLSRTTFAASYDEACGFVIRAKTEERAREIAQAHGGDETGFGFGKHDAPFWKNAELTSCLELKPTGTEALILRDYNGA